MCKQGPVRDWQLAQGVLTYHSKVYTLPTAVERLAFLGSPSRIAWSKQTEDRAQRSGVSLEAVRPTSCDTTENGAPQRDKIAGKRLVQHMF